MPKKHKNVGPAKNIVLKKFKTKHKFDMKKIVQDRLIEKERRKKAAELNVDINFLDLICETKMYDSAEDLPQSDDGLFNPANYNIPFESDSESDTSKSCSKRLLIMSIEIDPILVDIHYFNLIKTKWSPELKDIQNIFSNWRSDFISLTYYNALLKSEVKDLQPIGEHNFKLVMNYLTQCIKKNNNGLSKDELLMLARFVVNIYFDPHCGPMLMIIKDLFSLCITSALHENDENALMSFTEELYIQHVDNNLNKMVVDLFLPKNNSIEDKMYSYLTYKLYTLLLGKTNDKNPFPSNINNWFVQDLVPQNYFKLRPSYVLTNVIQLLEHVVVTFDLYKDEEKLNNMYDILYAALGFNARVLDKLSLVNILDQWRFKLLRLRINRSSLI